MYYISAARYQGKKVSRPGVRFGLLLPISLSFVSLGSSQTLTWASPPQRWWRNASLRGVKLATRALLGGLYVTEGGCLFGVGYPWVLEWFLVSVMIRVFLAKLFLIITLCIYSLGGRPRYLIIEAAEIWMNLFSKRQLRAWQMEFQIKWNAGNQAAFSS